MIFADWRFNVLGVSLLAVVAIGAWYRRSRQRALSQLSLNKKDAADSSADRSGVEKELGDWIPVKFDYPRFEPFTGDLNTVKPIPYRPFKWGDYHVTMGIRSMRWDEWIELDQQFFEYQKVREYRLRTRGDRAIMINDEQPGIVKSGHAAAEEFLHELAEYLSRKYPKIYRVERHPSAKSGSYAWYGENPIKSITIVPLGSTYILGDENPLVLASYLVQEDFAIMIEGTDGRYYLQGGAILIPGFWRLCDKIGMPLDEIHTSGNVPQFQSKLQLSMTRFFKRFPLDKPVVRNNYGFQVVTDSEAAAAHPSRAVDPTELAWSVSMHGDEDKVDFERSAHIRTEQTSEPQDEQKNTQSSRDLDPSKVHLRTERQTLRRLPRTGAIIFTIRVYQTAIDKLSDEPGAPGRLASAIRSWPDDVAQYKDRFAYEDIAHYLDKRHAEQIAAGVFSGDKGTSAYPF